MNASHEVEHLRKLFTMLKSSDAQNISIFDMLTAASHTDEQFADMVEALGSAEPECEKLEVAFPEVRCVLRWVLSVKARLCAQIKFWLVTVFGTLVSALSLFENAILIYIFVIHPRLRQTHFYYLCWIAVVDIFMAIAYILLMSTMVLIVRSVITHLLRASFKLSSLQIQCCLALPRLCFLCACHVRHLAYLHGRRRVPYRRRLIGTLRQVRFFLQNLFRA